MTFFYGAYCDASPDLEREPDHYTTYNTFIDTITFFFISHWKDGYLDPRDELEGAGRVSGIS